MLHSSADRLNPLLFLSILLYLLLPTPSKGDSPPSEGEASAPKLSFNLSGQEIPRYNLVSQFFAMALGPCRGGSTLNCDDFFRSLGIDPDSVAAEEVLNAIDEFATIRFGTAGLETRGDGGSQGVTLIAEVGGDLDRSLPAAELKAQLDQHEDQSARQIGALYGRLSKVLATEGVLEEFERYLVEFVARNSILHSSEAFGPEHPAIRRNELFLDAMAEEAP